MHPLHFGGAAIVMCKDSFKVCRDSNIHIDNLPIDDANTKRYSKFIDVLSRLPLTLQDLLRVLKNESISDNTFVAYAYMDGGGNLPDNVINCAYRQFLKSQIILRY